MNGTGQSPRMTQGHLESLPDDGWVPAPDYSPGGRVFKPAEKSVTELEGFSPGVCVLLNADRIASLRENWTLYQGGDLSKYVGPKNLRENAVLVEGHGFSRAATERHGCGL